MGLFTEVEVSPSRLPIRVHQLTGWQTKDVFEPNCMARLSINPDGRLIFIDSGSWTGALDYTGHMDIITSYLDEQGDKQFVELRGMFLHGSLVRWDFLKPYIPRPRLSGLDLDWFLSEMT